MSNVVPFLRPTIYGGTSLAVGTWLYKQTPGASCADAVVIVAIEGDAGPQAYDVFGGMRPLPRTRITVRVDGGEGETRTVDHIDAASLARFVVGDYRQHYGYLEAVLTDPTHRAGFVAGCQAEPARRAAEAARIEAEKERERAEVGPWFADLETAISGDRYSVRDTVEAKVIRRALKELVGVKASVNVRRYSMASGLDFGPAKGCEAFTDAEAERIAAVFPGLAWPSTIYGLGEERSGWYVADSAHPSKHEDRSDGQSDYYDPGGFRVGNAYLLAVSAILSEEVNR